MERWRGERTLSLAWLREASSSFSLRLLSSTCNLSTLLAFTLNTSTSCWCVVVVVVVVVLCVKMTVCVNKENQMERVFSAPHLVRVWYVNTNHNSGVPVHTHVHISHIRISYLFEFDNILPVCVCLCVQFLVCLLQLCRLGLALS